MLSVEDEAVVVAFRRHTLLPLDDCLYALQATIPHLTRSSLHRCLQRHGISRLPEVEGDKPGEAQVQGLSDRLLPHRHRRGPHRAGQALPARGDRPDLQVRLRRAAREGQPGAIAADFLRALIEAVPYKIHTVLTDNGTHFTTPGNTARQPPTSAGHGPRRTRSARTPSRYACAENDIDHRLTKPAIPGPTVRSRRMNRTIKEATVKRFHYETHDQLRSHLADFVTAYNFARRLKTLKASRPTKPSAKPGQPSRNDSPSIRSTKCRD